MIRLVIADDHAIMRGGLRQIVAMTSDISVAGEATDGAQTMALVQNLEFDLLLLDMSMPGLSGIELIRRLGQLRPGLPILVMSMNNESQIVSRAIKAGASGYLSKDIHPEVLLSAIRKVASGGRFVEPALLEEMAFMTSDHEMSPRELLSDREFQIMQMLASGQPIGDIATAIHLSPKTVSTYKMRLMQKLGIDNNTALIRYCIQQGVTQR